MKTASEIYLSNILFKEKIQKLNLMLLTVNKLDERINEARRVLNHPKLIYK
jgi:hypothetical protein